VRLILQGKVRDVHDLGDDRLLVVTSDRISAYDVVMPTPIPDKGRVLTATSAHWFAETTHIAPNHLRSVRLADLPEETRDPELAGRTMVVERLEMLPIECVVRGYLAGSGWRDYRDTGAVCGHALPGGLRQAERLPAPIFTPATKAHEGHDENITRDEAADLVGGDTLAEAERISLELYAHAAARCEAAGIILADTKFELGRDATGPGFVAVLAGGPPRPRHEPTVVRQAVPARLAGRVGVGPHAARAGAARRRRRGHPRPVHGSLRTADRPNARQLDPGVHPMTRVVVTVTPRAEILDPQGQTVARALHHLGFEGVGDVRIGKRIVLEVDGAEPVEQAREMCEKLLVNRLVEDYEITLDD